MIAWYDDMIPGYENAIALLDVAVKRALAAAKAAGDPCRRAAAKARYDALIKIRRELKKTVKYLKNYERVGYIGSKSFEKVTDCECIYQNGSHCRQWRMGGHQIAAGGTEAPRSGGD